MKRIKVRLVEESEREIVISTDYIKLDCAMKLSGLAQTGGEAKSYILDGLVFVNGEKCLMRGKKLREGDVFSFSGKKIRVTK